MKTHVKHRVGAIGIALLLLASCKKYEPVPEPEADIYISGYILVNNNSNPVAHHWKNGIPISVNDPTPGSEANAIVIFENKVVMAGEFIEKPCFWIDGERYDLSQNGLYYGNVSEIALDGTILYLAGTIQIGKDAAFSFAGLWKINLNNLQKEFIPLSVTNSAVYGMTLQNQEVWISGTENGLPGYWRSSQNGFISLNQNPGIAVSIDFLGDEQQTLGIGPDLQWGLWNTKQTFTPIGLAKDEGFIIGTHLKSADSIYFFGYISPPGSNENKAYYWLNSKKVNLSTRYSTVKDMAINGTHVYFAGTNLNEETKLNAGYWRNHKWFALSQQASRATGIFIVPK